MSDRSHSKATISEHDPTACARAWQTLRMAHDRVAERLTAELATSCQLVLSEFDALLYLRTHPEESVRIGALRDAVALSQPAVSRLVARLESRDLVARADDAEDGRSTRIELTAAGRSLIDRAMEIHARTVHDALTGKLSPAEQAALLDVLSRVGE